MKRIVVWLGTLIVLATLVTPAVAAPSDTTVQSAVSWLRTQQQADGGFAGLGSGSDGGTSADAVMAFAAAGIDPGLVLANGRSIADFLPTTVSTYGSTTGGAAKLSLAATASGLNPRNLGGIDLVARVQSAFNATTGLYSPQLYVDAYAILSLVAATAPVPSAALDALVNGQAADGGWSFTGSKDRGQSDTNTTAIVLEALAAAGRPHSTVVGAALAYLHAAQTSNGSFVYQIGAENPPAGDANSTAVVIQALEAVGEDPSSATWRNAVSALQHFQNSDGAFRYRDDTPGDNLLATVQAIPALLLKPLPILASAGFSHATAEERAMQPERPKVGCTYFAVTQHNLCAGFQAFWNQYGGLATYGYPLTEEFQENGVTVQYFERARFEWHPGTNPARYDVLLGLVGDEVAQTANLQTTPPFKPVAPKANCTDFAPTGHNLCAGFQAFWNRYGGVATYGMPISEEFPQNGVTVQYFERARFEWHPGTDPARYDVELGRLGAAELQGR